MPKFQYRPRTADDIAARIQETASDSQGVILPEFKVYQAKKGDNWIRILPATWDNARHWAFDVWVHYSAGPDKTHVICNSKMKLGACFGCEQRILAERAGDDALTKELAPRRRAGLWLVDRNAESEGPQVWLMPATLEEDIQSLSVDRTDGSIYLVDDPYNGYDVTFERTGERINTRYTSPQIARRASSVNPAMLEYIAENPIPQCLIWRDYAEVKSTYEGGMGEAVAPQAGPVYGRGTTAAPRGAPAASGGTGYPPSGQAPGGYAAPVGRRALTPSSAPPPQGQWVPPSTDDYQGEQYAIDPNYPPPENGYDPNAAPPWDAPPADYYDPSAPLQYEPPQQQYQPPPQQYSPPPVQQQRRMAPPPPNGQRTPVQYQQPPQQQYQPPQQQYAPPQQVAPPVQQQRRPMPPPQQQAGPPPQGQWAPPGRGAPPQQAAPQRGGTSAAETAAQLRQRYTQR